MRKMYNFTAVFYPTASYDPINIIKYATDKKLFDINYFGQLLVVPLRVSSRCVAESKCRMFSKHLTRFTGLDYYYIFI